MDELQERCQLAQTRIRELIGEIASYPENRRDYWLSCARLALGEEPADINCCDYAFCADVFGKAAGKYYCLLFAQMCLMTEFYRHQQEELICVCCELLVELFLIDRDEENISAMRDSLYWFYSDYIEVYVSYHLERIQEGDELCFCGPMLFMERKTYDSCPVWKQHACDFGLYMGSRYAERYVQAVNGCTEQADNESRHIFIRHFDGVRTINTDEGFCVQQRQMDELDLMIRRITKECRELS